jgi:hypothetical protein
MSDHPHAPPGRPLDEPEDDPIVAEVRAIREATLAEAGYDIERLYERFKEREEAERAAGRVFLPPPDRRGGRTDAA